jgi:hypothetical protein
MPENKFKVSIKDFFSPLTLIVSLILFIGLILVTLAILFLGKNPLPDPNLVPDITKIPAPTLTARPLSPSLSPSPTPTSIFFLPEGAIGLGAYVQVIGTGGAGLRMRSDPGLSSTVNFTALESEVFLVIDGPVVADDYTWWHLEAPYDTTRNGWSASEFLTPIVEEESD